MKKIIRTSVFETNSSSTHTISLGIEEKPFIYDHILPDEQGRVNLNGGEFGWQWEKTNDALAKANYAAVATLYGLDSELLTRVIKEQTQCSEVVINISKEYDNANFSYIDHDSVHVCPRDYEALKAFIFNKNAWLFLGNDNDEPTWGFYDVPTFTNEGLQEVVYKYQFKCDVLPTVDAKFKDFPTTEEWTSFVASLDLRYDKNKDEYQLNAFYAHNRQDSFEDYYELEQDPNLGHILLFNKKAYKKAFRSTDEEINIEDFFTDENIMKVPFELIEL